MSESRLITKETAKNYNFWYNTIICGDKPRVTNRYVGPQRIVKRNTANYRSAFILSIKIII